jgi:hypothetical protein
VWSTRVRSRPKAHLTKFTSEPAEGLSKPRRAFAGERWFGIQVRQQEKLSPMGRSLDGAIRLIKTENRLSRNLKAKGLEERCSEAWIAATFLGEELKLKILCEKLLIISRRFFGIPPFRFYALADGIRAILTGSRCASSVELPPNLQLDRLLAWGRRKIEESLGFDTVEMQKIKCNIYIP